MNRRWNTIGIKRIVERKKEKLRRDFDNDRKIHKEKRLEKFVITSKFVVVKYPKKEKLHRDFDNVRKIPRERDYESSQFRRS